MNEELVTKITEEKLKGIQVSKPFYKSKLGLPDFFRFGFEIEALIDHEKLIKAMEDYNERTLFNNTTFRGVEETTIEYEENQYGGLDYSRGGEIVTPILADSEETWQDMKLACKYLREKARCVENCSVHINIGAQALGNNYQNWYNFMRIVASCEPELYRFFADGKEIRWHAITGGFRASYAMPVAEKIRIGLANTSEETPQDINQLLNDCGFSGDYQDRKDKSISLKGVYKTDNEMIPYSDLDEPAYGRRIEIRMPNGTFDENLIQQFTYVSGKIFELSRNLTPEKEQKLEKLLKVELSSNYNAPVDISRVLDVANLLFDSREDKLQFLFTTCGKEKVQKILENRDEILELIRNGNNVLEFLPEELRDDREIVLEAVKSGGSELEFASDRLKKDRSIVYTACQNYGRSLGFADSEYFSDREVVLAAVRSNGFAIQYADDDLKKDREIAFEAVKSKSFAIKYIGEDLRDDKDIAMEAVKKDGFAVKFVGNKLKKDKDIAILAVTNNRYSIRELDDAVRYDRDVLLIVYSINETVQEFLTYGKVQDEKRFFDYLERDNNIYQYMLKEVINGNKQLENYLFRTFEVYRKAGNEYGNYKAASKYESIIGYTLERVTPDTDKELFLKFISADGSILEYLPDVDRNNREIVRTALESDPFAIEYASEDLRNDRSIVIETVRRRGITLEYASDDLRKDKTVVLEAVKNEANAIKYASPDLQLDREVVITAIRQNAGVIYVIDKKLLEERDIALEIVKSDGKYLENLNETFRADRDIVIAAIESKPFAIEFAHKDLRDDKEIGLKVVRLNGFLLEYLSKRLRNDREVVEAAINQMPRAIEYASERLKKIFEKEEQDEEGR